MLFRTILTLCLLAQPMMGWWCQLAALEAVRACRGGDGPVCCELMSAASGESSCEGQPGAPRCPDGPMTRPCFVDVPRMSSASVRLERRAERADPVGGFFKTQARVPWSASIHAAARPNGLKAPAVKDLRPVLCVWVI